MYAEGPLSTLNLPTSVLFCRTDIFAKHRRPMLNWAERCVNGREAAVSYYRLWKHAAALYNFKDFNHGMDKSPWEQQDTHMHTHNFHVNSQTQTLSKQLAAAQTTLGHLRLATFMDHGEKCSKHLKFLKLLCNDHRVPFAGFIDGLFRWAVYAGDS